MMARTNWRKTPVPPFDAEGNVGKPHQTERHQTRRRPGPAEVVTHTIDMEMLRLTQVQQDEVRMGAGFVCTLSVRAGFFLDCDGGSTIASSETPITRVANRVSTSANPSGLVPAL